MSNPSRMRFNSSAVTLGAPGYPERNGEIVIVLWELFEPDRDPEVGRMFRIEFSDGVTTDAFADELEEVI